MSDLDQARLDEATSRWSPAARYFPQIDSTNGAAVDWARRQAPHGALVVADHQTAGRGRMGRRWFSAPGASLLFSLVLRPSIAAEELPLVSLAAGVAVCRAVAREGLAARVKWPNDVTIAGRKVAGILAEAELASGRAGYVVLGVGVNVNIAPHDLPADLVDSATSLALEAGRPLDRVRLLAGFLEELWPLEAALEGRRPDPILGPYRILCETLGRRVRIVTGGRILEGRAADIDRAGGLLLDSGEVARSGELVHLVQDR